MTYCKDLKTCQISLTKSHSEVWQQCDF
uniref:Uncharacterized protein n=1 Tax=Anguilla anguilla TaxID=7936 RepID=A0A0E9XWP9_ANGAN